MRERDAVFIWPPNQFFRVRVKTVAAVALVVGDEALHQLSILVILGYSGAVEASYLDA